jgi:ATP-binding cassette subfamily F protein uup
LLEEILLSFDGTLLLVSHDRAFLDNVVTSSIVFEGDGEVNHYVGGYQDWINHGGSFNSETSTGKNAGTSQEKPEQPKPLKQQLTQPRKLSYMLQRELDQLPGKIEEAETALGQLEETISSPEFYQQEQSRIDEVLKQVSAAQESLEKLYARWEEIEQGQQ